MVCTEYCLYISVCVCVFIFLILYSSVKKTASLHVSLLNSYKPKQHPLWQEVAEAGLLTWQRPVPEIWSLQTALVGDVTHVLSIL